MKQVKQQYTMAKSKYTSTMLYLLILALLFVLPTACVTDKLSDDMQEKGELVDVELNVHVGVETSDDPNATPQEQQLTSLYVFSFRSSGYLDKLEIFSEAEIAGQNMTMEVEVGENKKFAALANIPSQLKDKLRNIRSLFDLRKLLLDHSIFSFNEIGDASKYGKDIPFAGVVDNITVHRAEDNSTPPQSRTGSSNQTVTISVDRIVSKVELSIIKAAENKNKVEIHSLKVINSPEQSYALNNFNIHPATHFPPINSTPSYDLAITDLNGMEVTSIINKKPGEGGTVEPSYENKLETKPRYIFEHISPSNEESKATAFQLELKIDGRISQYKIAFKVVDPKDTSKKLFNIYRNAYYLIRVTVNHNDINISYGVGPWDTSAGIWDKEAGVDDSGIKFTDWNVVPEYEWEI